MKVRRGCARAYSKRRFRQRRVLWCAKFFELLSLSSNKTLGCTVGTLIQVWMQFKRGCVKVQRAQERGRICVWYMVWRVQGHCVCLRACRQKTRRTKRKRERISRGRLTSCIPGAILACRIAIQAWVCESLKKVCACVVPERFPKTPCALMRRNF